SAVHPKTLPPRQSRETSRSLEPIFTMVAKPTSKGGPRPGAVPPNCANAPTNPARPNGPAVGGPDRSTGPTCVETLALSWVECQRNGPDVPAPATTGRPRAVHQNHSSECSTPGRGGHQVANIKPLEDRIVVQASEAETTTASGIVIPDTAKEKPQEGKVLAVGPGRIDDKGNRIPLDVKVGDVVIYSKYGGTEVKYNGEEYLILS